MLERPGEEIYDVIRYFGSRGKIFNVHFRNIKGGFLHFKRLFQMMGRGHDSSDAGLQGSWLRRNDHAGSCSPN